MRLSTGILIAFVSVFLLLPSVGRAQEQLYDHNLRVNDLVYPALDAMDAGNKKEALDLLLRALEIEPDSADLLFGIGAMSLDLEKYTDTLWGLQEAQRLGLSYAQKPLVWMGIAYLVLGDYERAYRSFDEALQHAPDDKDIRGWRVAAAFGRGGWEAAVEAFKSAPYTDDSDERWPIYAVTYGVLTDADARAQRAGLRYPRLTHLSLTHELLDHVHEWRFVTWDRDMRAEKWDVLWQTIRLYRDLPLKPQPPSRAVAKVQEAQSYLRQGIIDYRPVNALAEATTIAPWWPDAHYNLAIIARDTPYTLNFRYLTDEVIYAPGVTAQEFTFYLALAPRGPKAAEACRQLQAWSRPCPGN